MNQVYDDGYTEELQETARGGGAQAAACTGDEAGMRACLDELEGRSREGFSVFRAVRDEDGELSGFRCIYLNPAAKRLLGRLGRELLPEELLGSLVTEGGGDMIGSFTRAFLTGEVREGRVRLGLGDEERWFRGVLTPFKDGVTARFQQLEEEELAREALPPELVHRLVAGASDDVLWDWDLLSGQLAWGEGAEQAFGYGPDAQRGTLAAFVERLHPEDRDRVSGGLCSAIQGDGDVWSDAFRLRRADGSYALVLGRGFLARNRVGKPLRMLGSMVDLTGRVGSCRESVREVDAMFRATFDQAAVGIAVLSADGEWLRANGRLREVLGYSDEALSRLTLSALAHPDDRARLQRRLGRMRSGETRSETWELRLRRRDGAFRWIRLALSAAHEPAGDPGWLVAVAEDIDDRKRLEEEMRRALEFETRLYGMMGHDLRSPLAALKATVAGLLSRPEAISGPQRKALARIARSTHRIQRLVEEVLDYTQVRLGAGVTVHPREVDAHALCEQVVQELERIHPGRISFRDSPVDERAGWDPARVRQLLEGLMDHALTHGAHGQPVSLVLGGDADALTFTVRYTGEFISAEQLPRLFEPFSDADGGEPTVKLSQGLGLYLAREVAQAHGGSVSIESSREGSTAFVVKLPRFPFEVGDAVRH